MKKTFTVYKKLNAHQRIYNRVFRSHQLICVMAYRLVLKIHSVVEIQIQASFAIKVKTVDWL